MFNFSHCSDEGLCHRGLCFTQCPARVSPFKSYPGFHANIFGVISLPRQNTTDGIRFGIESFVIDIHIQTSLSNLDN